MITKGKYIKIKHGYDGLIAAIYYAEMINDKVNKSRLIGEIVVTTDINEILNFLDLDTEKYARGFEDLKEIFDFVIKSKYFRPNMFDLANLNKINRERDQKRSTYSGFLEYIKDMRSLDDSVFFYKDKKVYLGLIDHYFPGFLRKYRDLEIKEETLRDIHSKFNGNLIMEMFPELSGKGLGKFMTDYKGMYMDHDNFQNYIIKSTAEEVADSLTLFHALHTA